MPSLFENDHTSCSVKDFKVGIADIAFVRKFVETWHYSQSSHISSVQYVFSLVHENDLIGAMIYGLPAMVGQWKKYAEYGVEKERDVIELRRLCCIDDTPRNTESYFIGKTIKWIKKNTDHKIILSYADPHHGHAGTIYKASNFKHIGMTSPGKIIDWNGKRYHDKTIRDYKRSHFKKTGERVLLDTAVKLKEALESGKAQWIETPGKHIYVYDLKRGVTVQKVVQDDSPTLLMHLY
jgi:hypothetical protein